MDGEARDYNAQQFSVRDLERKYAEAIVQLNSLQSVHKQTVDIFEKEKLVFKVRVGREKVRKRSVMINWYLGHRATVSRDSGNG